MSAVDFGREAFGSDGGNFDAVFCCYVQKFVTVVGDVDLDVDFSRNRFVEAGMMKDDLSFIHVFFFFSSNVDD